MADNLNKIRELQDVLKANSAEFGKQKTLIGETLSSYTKLNSVAAQLKNNEAELSDLTDKQVEALKNKAAIALDDLNTQAENVRLKAKQLGGVKKLNKEERALLTAKKRGFKFEQDILDTAKRQVAERKKLNKQLGVAGGVMKGIAKIPILGDIFDAKEATKAMSDELGTGGSRLGALSKGFGNVGKQVTEGLLNPANLALMVVVGIGKAFQEVDKATGELAKSLNLSYNEAIGVRQELSSIAFQSGDSALNTKRLQETLSFVNKELGTSGRMSESNLTTFTKLREQAGMTNEEIMSMQKFSMVMGGDLEDNVVNFQAQAKALSVSKGTAINVKQLMSDMTKVSNRTKMSIEGGAEGLAKSAVNAKLMGGNLDQVASIADSLLNFEQSIEKELSAELLLGKDINLEKARTAALNNDMATVAAEITKQAGSAAEFGDMNRIQQEAIAAAMGMSADQMADMLFEQEALKSIGTDLNDEQQKAFDLAKEKYGVEEASRMLASDAQGEGIDGLIDQQTAQQEFTDSVEKMKELFVDIAQNVLPAIKTVLTPIMFVVGSIATGIQMFVDALKKGKGPAVALGVVLAGMAIPLITSAVAGIFKAFSSIPFGLGIPLAIAGVVGMFNQVDKAKTKVKDGVIKPDGGIALSTQKGGIQLDKGDSVVAGTNLFGEKGGGSGGGSTSGGGANMSQTNALLQQLINVISAGGDVVLDGQKVGNALNLVAYKTQ